MSAVKVWCRFEVEIDGQVHALGRHRTDAPYLVSVDGDVHDQQKDVSDASTATLFDIDDDLSDFDVLLLESDQDVVVELTVDKGGENGTAYATLPLKAGNSGKPGPPFCLFRNDAYANYTSPFTGTLDTIETVKVRNDSGATAHVRVVAVT